MSDEPEPPAHDDFATLFARAGTGPSLDVGQVVRGRIIQIGAETVFVDVQGKGEALLARAELEDEQGKVRVQVGDEIEATVVSAGDEVHLSQRVLRGAQARQALEVAARTGVPVEGKVTAINKGGYEVTVGGLRAFCPFSQMDVRRIDAPEELLQRVLEFRITKYDERGRNIVLSRRQLLEAEAARAAEEARKRIVPDAILPGTVAGLAEFGAFVDLGGIQGLVPASEISHSRVGRPSDRLRIGQAVTVKVLRVDPETGKIALSLKALEDDPWAAVPDELHERQVVRGRAVRMTEFGLFVELLPGVDGLLHLTEIPRDRQRAMKEAAATGAEVAVLVLGIDLQKRRIALALAPDGAAPGEPLESAVAPGAVLTGTVERVEPFGIFVRLGPGQVGLVPNAEMGTDRGTDHRKGFPPGAAITVVVLGIEEGGRRIRLSRAQALRHAEEADTRAYVREASTRGGGFGLTLGEVLRRGPRTQRSRPVGPDA
jgi:small subunit ribosomal protein S1